MLKIKSEIAQDTLHRSGSTCLPIAVLDRIIPKVVLLIERLPQLASKDSRTLVTIA